MIAGIAILLMLLCFNPVGTRWMPQCVFHALTGLDCPGCGSMRFTHAMLHGHPLEALSYNYFLAIVYPLTGLIVYTLVSNSPRAQRWSRWVQSPPMIAALLIAAVAWTVVRNIYGL